MKTFAQTFLVRTGSLRSKPSRGPKGCPRTVAPVDIGEITPALRKILRERDVSVRANVCDERPAIHPQLGPNVLQNGPLRDPVEFEVAPAG